MEKILCPAIWFKNAQLHLDDGPRNITKGYVLCGFRHTQILTLYTRLSNVIPMKDDFEQGFLTTTNSFVNRLEALKIAITAGQVKEGDKFKGLISEDLYRLS